MPKIDSFIPFLTEFEAITTLKDVVAGIGGWDVKELTVQKFTHTSGHPVNVSYGVKLAIPSMLEEVGDFRQLWLGYVNHVKAPAGVYAGLTAWPAPVTVPALKNGYRECPFESEFVLLKPLVSEKELVRIAKKQGKVGVVEKLRKVIKATYPFSLKK